jgi:hypothetical protein
MAYDPAQAAFTPAQLAQRAGTSPIEGAGSEPPAIQLSRFEVLALDPADTSGILAVLRRGRRAGVETGLVVGGTVDARLFKAADHVQEARAKELWALRVRLQLTIKERGREVEPITAAVPYGGILSTLLEAPADANVYWRTGVVPERHRSLLELVARALGLEARASAEILPLSGDDVRETARRADRLRSRLRLAMAGLPDVRARLDDLERELIGWAALRFLTEEPAVRSGTSRDEEVRIRIEPLHGWTSGAAARPGRPPAVQTILAVYPATPERVEDAADAERVLRDAFARSGGRVVLSTDEPDLRVVLAGRHDAFSFGVHESTTGAALRTLRAAGHAPVQMDATGLGVVTADDTYKHIEAWR